MTQKVKQHIVNIIKGASKELITNGISAINRNLPHSSDEKNRIEKIYTI